MDPRPPLHKLIATTRNARQAPGWLIWALLVLAIPLVGMVRCPAALELWVVEELALSWGVATRLSPEPAPTAGKPLPAAENTWAMRSVPFTSGSRVAYAVLVINQTPVGEEEVADDDAFALSATLQDRFPQLDEVAFDHLRPHDPRIRSAPPVPPPRPSGLNAPATL